MAAQITHSTIRLDDPTDVCTQNLCICIHIESERAKESARMVNSCECKSSSEFLRE